MKDLTITSLINLPHNFFQNTKDIENLKLVLYYHRTIDNIKPFNHMSKLISLDINGCSQLNGSVICDLVNLEKLQMGGCLKISQESLIKLEKLRFLDISGCVQMTDIIFTYPFAMNLRALSINYGGNNITNDGIVKLQNLESIDASSVTDTNITIDVFHKLPKLKSVNISRSVFLTNENLGEIPIVNTMALSIYGNNADDFSAENLIHLKDIRNLTICTGCYKFLTKEILDCWESHGMMQSIKIVKADYDYGHVFTDFKKLRIYVEETLLEEAV